MQPIKAYQINWDHQAMQRYLYGATVVMPSVDRVVLSSELIPPTAVLMQWDSLHHYQAQRQSPTLPLLQPGRRYYMACNVLTKPAQSVYWRLNFFDHYHEKIGSQLLKEETGSFDYPLNATRYTLELVNMRSQSLDYQTVLLSEQPVPAHQTVYLSDLLNEETSSDVLTVIFEEPSNRYLGSIAPTRLEAITNCIVVQAIGKWAQAYLTPVIEQQLVAHIQQLEHEYEIGAIHFVGYGPISNLAASYYGRYFAKGQAWGTADALSDAQLRQLQLELGLEALPYYHLDTCYLTQVERQTALLVDYTAQLETFAEVRKGRER